ncbi:non-ribosomal peptide synthetase [Methylocapsa acidiphila]|uniref:non-ribosomal peptide synthetase n=1 Tax=Methylocapsa acidiphila TaxID=133552 RepID=UPI0003F97EB7|nr:non-ribosomal peptide synthetase [Methylocapsa acidiphila]
MKQPLEQGESVAHDEAAATEANIVSVLRRRAAARQERPAFVFLADGENESARMEFAELDLCARAIAAFLQRVTAAGRRALLLYPPGLDYIKGFMGCLYAGVAATPAYPPTRRHADRLRAVIADSSPDVVMTTTSLAAQLAGLAEDAWGRPDIIWLTTDDLTSDAAAEWSEPQISGDALAFLQYTSGSTGRPKGVMVTHGALIANEAAISRAFGHDAESTVVGWLPLYHDMGLIGNVLQPLYVGATSVLMPPLAFLERPARWLQAISTYGAKTSGGPNFGYELCVRKISADERRDLDLNGWRLAFNGSEPVRAATLDRFAAEFAENGFRREAFFPCYGLAESTLFVTGPSIGEGPATRRFDRNACGGIDATEAAFPDAHTDLVGCGRAAAGHALRIVDPAERRICEDGRIGEIWVSGPSVAAGYWGKPDESARLFRAALCDDPDTSFLRTGDLGFLLDGELFIAGRIKDLIILRGRNFDPSDLEHVIEQGVAGIQPGGVAAFSIAREGEEALVIAAEVQRHYFRVNGAAPLFDATRAAIARHFDLGIHEIALVHPGALPKTTSGKLRRGACREAYLDGALKLFARSGEQAPNETGAYIPTPQDGARGIEHFLRGEIARLLRRPILEIDPTKSLAELGLDSLQTVALKHTLDAAFDIDLPLALLLSDAPTAGLAASIVNLPSRSPASTGTNTVGAEATRLTAAQRAIARVHRLDESGLSHNLHLAIELTGGLDIERFEAALILLCARHEQLRTLFSIKDDIAEPVAARAEAPRAMLTTIDAQGWTDSELQAELGKEARRPFDLATEPPLRALLYRLRPGRNVLFLGAHHIAIDFWSLLLVLRELSTAYAALGSGETPALPPAPSHAEFVAREDAYLASPEAARGLAYWRRALAETPPPLPLPTDFPRPAAPDHRGASKALRLDRDVATSLRVLAAREKTSLFTLLLAVWQVLLHRYTGRRDIIVGSPSSGRLQGRFAGLVANCVNPIALRGDVDPRLPFLDFMRRLRETAQEALVHQEFPFSLLVEELRPERFGDQWPVYQTWFVLQQATPGFPQALSALALGESGELFDLCGCAAAPLALRDRVENFDLKLMAAETDAGLLCSFQYRTALFRSETIDRVAAHFESLIVAVLRDPQRPIGELSMLTADDMREKARWNDTSRQWPDVGFLPQLIEAQASARGDAPALLFGDESLSYAELNRRANRVAHGLIARGVDADDIVAVRARRSFALVIGLLGVVKAGAAYLPLDPDDPVERLAALCRDAAPKCLLLHDEIDREPPAISAPTLRLDDAASSFAGEPDHNPSCDIDADQLAYAIFTSGSTGRPKGVGISHAALRNRLLWMRSHFGIGGEDAILQKTSYTFDVSVWEIFCTLLVGARMVLAGPDDHRDPQRLVALVARHGVTILHFVPSMLRVFLDAADLGGCASLRHVVCSGEALTGDLVRRFKEASPAKLHNLYGPTEAAIDVSAAECDDPEDVSIGWPIANTSLYILAAGLQPVPIGATGELCIGGAQVARGYVERPDLTAAAFIPDPFGPPGARLYRSGDLVRRRPDGSIAYIGRIDHQLKIRGFRIEPGEIEACLLRHPDVTGAAVLALEGEPGERRLAAWLQGKFDDGREAEKVESLRAHLRQSLPDYMIPAGFVFLSSLPLTASGKLDRKRLPAPNFASQLASQRVEPRTEAEATLAHIWADVLQVEHVGVEDNFFALGGDSIRGIVMASRAAEAGLRLSPAALFRAPTIAELARLAQPIESAARVIPTEAPRPHGRRDRLRPQDFPLASLSQDELDALPIDPDSVEDIYPLAPMQEGILFHSLSHRGTGVYVMQDRYAISGRIDQDAFARAWRKLVEDHAILRTSFLWDCATRPHQLVHRAPSLCVESFDWPELPPHEKEARLDAMLAAEREAGFDLARAPLMRIRLLRLDEERHLCVRSFHHIIMDEWCTSPLLLQFRDYYAAFARGSQAPSPRAPGQFRDYLAYLQRQDSTAAERFWRRELEGFAEPTPLVVDKASAASEKALGAVTDVAAELSLADTQKLAELARGRRLTVNTFVQGALALLLARYSGRADVLFGVTVAGRPATLPGVETTIGLFINGLPLRVRIRPEQTVADWLSELLERNIEMRSHEHVSLVDIQRWSGISRADGELFQHLLTFENAPVDPSLLERRDGLEMQLAANRVHTNYPLTFVAIPDRGLKLRLTYQQERFDSAAMTRMVGHWKTLIEGLLRGIDDRVESVSLLSEADRRMFAAWNETGASDPDAPDLVARFEAQAAQAPEKMAIACCGDSLAYAELNAHANRVARGLAGSGIGSDDVVALLADRGVEFLVMMLAIFKAGGAYLPLDPAHPDGRIVQVLAESHASRLLHGEAQGRRAEGLCLELGDAAPVRIGLKEAEAKGAHAPAPTPARDGKNLAVVIATSGSTGTPKLAMVEQAGMVNNLLTKVPALELAESDVIAQTASQCFDISVWQFLTAIAIGARVEVFPDEISRDPRRLLHAVAETGVTILETVPSMIRALLDAADEDGATLPALRWLIPSGEAFPPDLCRRWMRRFPTVRLLNAYGPAECSDDVTYHEIDFPDAADATVSIGRPTARTRIHIVDRWLDHAPIGAPGEICVAGVQVGRGYLNRPDLTAAAFIPDPFGGPGERLYRTGDLGRFRPDGLIEFLGRMDHQIKIRGNRVEPGEVEACLLSCPGIGEAAVVARKTASRAMALVAYVVGAPRALEPLRAHIRARLPDYMTPQAFVFLDALPLSPNGKIDRSRLPDPPPAAFTKEGGGAPRTPIEEILAGIWAEILNVERPGVEDNFFDLGGHSLLATQVASRIRQAFVIELPLRSIFEHPTIARLAAVLDKTAAESAAPPLLPAPREADAPLSFAQQRLWYMDRLDPGNAFYNFVAAIRIKGPLDAAALEAALADLVARHEALRTGFAAGEGDPAQFILPALEVPLARVDLSETPSAEREGALRQALEKAARESFDIARPPLLRAALYGLDPGGADHALLLVFHHIIFDGWSFAIFVKELAAFYRSRRGGADAGLAPLCVQYPDFAAWQRDWLRGPELERRLAWWKAHLAGAPALLELPADRPRAPQTPAAGGRHGFEISPELTRKIADLCRRQGATLFMALLAVFKLMLHVLARRDDIVVGVDIAGRRMAATEGLIGFFVNLLALRTDLGGNPKFADLLVRLRETTLNGFAQQDAPFDKVVEAVRPPRALGHAPIFQVKFVLHNIPFPDVRMDGLAFSPIEIETGRTELDLVLHVFQEAGGEMGEREGARLRAAFEYRTDLFNPETVARFADYFVRLLEKATADPGARLDALAAGVTEVDREHRGRRIKSDEGPLSGPAAGRGRRIAKPVAAVQPLADMNIISGGEVEP